MSLKYPHLDDLNICCRQLDSRYFVTSLQPVNVLAGSQILLSDDIFLLCWCSKGWELKETRLVVPEIIFAIKILTQHVPLLSC